MFIRNTVRLVCVCSFVTSYLPADETFTYSYSNLFDGQIELRNGFEENEMVVAVEESFALWASVAPLTFVELVDSGPPVSDRPYNRASHPTIRIGHHAIENERDENGDTTTILGHAFFPGANGRDSDVHLDDSGIVWNEGRFFSVVAHEIGHALGLDHFDLSTAVMNSSLSAETTFSGASNGQLFDSDIRAITKKYGQGTGDVVVSRVWSGGPSGSWAEAQNWDMGHYPTRRARVTIDQPTTIELSERGMLARSIRFANSHTALQMQNGGLSVAEDVVLGDGSGGATRHTLNVDQSSLVIGGDLVLGNASLTESTLTIASGRVEVGNRITDGAGFSQIDMSGGELLINATTPGPSLIALETEARLHIPTDDSLGRRWTEADFDDSKWKPTAPSIGYERGTGFEDNFATDVESLMFDNNTSLYLRIPFDVQDVGILDNLELDVSFDDGFVAYLNGQRVAARNAANVVTWNDRAVTSVEDEDAQVPVSIDLTPHLGKLRNGGNVLAIHGLNRSKTNDDFLLVPTLGSDQMAGIIEVDKLNFTGGEIFGVSRIEGDLSLQDGEFTPNGATDRSAPVALEIAGDLHISDSATLRLDFSDSGHDSLSVRGSVKLDGELRLVQDSTARDAVGLSDAGSFSEHVLLTGSSVVGTFSTSTFDGMPLGHMGDGLFRHLEASDTAVTLTSYRAIPGDANGDGEFNSGDLVFVFTRGEYEDNSPGNSDWTDGDWNGDFEFDSGDFIAAFQSGQYEAGSIFVAVPEPGRSALPLAVALVACCLRRQRSTNRTANCFCRCAHG